MGSCAFSGNIKLTQLDIPESVTVLPTRVLAGCISIKNIILPESITVIGELAFSNCVNLESVDIPESVASIGGSAFFNCTKLTTVIIDSPDIASGPTSQTAKGCLIENATAIYIKSGLEVGSYVTTNFTETTSDKDGYVMYKKN